MTPAATPPSSRKPAIPARGPVRRLPWAYFALLLYASTALAANAIGFVVTLPLLEEAGYPDTYMLYDAREYAHTGRIYRAATEAPYNPSPYSPLFYLVLSVPFRFSEPSNPFLGPRLIVGAVFTLCVLVSVSMAHALVRHRSVALWASLLGFSVLLFGPWIPQTRVDFMALLFALLSVRLLMSRSRVAPLLAGFAAGMAFAFKLTIVAAALSGLLWLLWRRRYRPAVEFVTGAVVAGAGGYLAFLPFEPYMLDHLLAFRSSLRDYRLWPSLVHTMAREPVFLLALSTVPLALRQPGCKRRLLLLYGATALLIGSVTAIQPGAGANYFEEVLFVAIPLASVAPLRLFRLKDRAQVVQILLAGLILVVLVKPAVTFARTSLARDVAGRNAEWVGLGNLFRDRRVLAFVPQVAFLTRKPPVTEPFLVRFLELQGRFDTGPLSDRIRAREFDLVVTHLDNRVYRGVEHLSPSFRRAIRSSYAPFCAMEQRLYHLPRGQQDSGPLADGLLHLGCKPMRDIQDELVVSW